MDLHFVDSKQKQDLFQRYQLLHPFELISVFLSNLKENEPFLFVQIPNTTKAISDMIYEMPYEQLESLIEQYKDVFLDLCEQAKNPDLNLQQIYQLHSKGAYQIHAITEKESSYFYSDIPDIDTTYCLIDRFRNPYKDEQGNVLLYRPHCYGIAAVYETFSYFQALGKYKQISIESCDFQQLLRQTSEKSLKKPKNLYPIVMEELPILTNLSITPNTDSQYVKSLKKLVIATKEIYEPIIEMDQRMRKMTKFIYKNHFKEQEKPHDLIPVTEEQEDYER